MKEKTSEEHPLLFLHNRYQLSPRHQQASKCRDLLRRNEAINSIISVGNMEKMGLIAINNRSLFNYGKVKRAEWTNRKKDTTFLPDLHLHLDNRSKGRIRSQKRGDQAPEDKTEKALLCERLIEQYIQKLRKENRINTFTDRGQLISEACREIHNKLAKLNSGKSEWQEEREREREEKEEKKRGEVGEHSQRLSFRLRNSKKHHSVTEASYQDDVTRIHRQLEYSTKQRNTEEKLFLRRIMQLKQAIKT